MTGKNREFTEIQRQGDIKKPITAKILSVHDPIGRNTNKPYLKVALQGNSVMNVLAFDEALVNEWKEELEPKIGTSYTFQTATLSAVTRDQRFPSNSNLPFEFRFISKPPPKNSNVQKDKSCTSGLYKAIARSKKKGAFEMKMTDLEFVPEPRTTLYRYLGCPACKSKVYQNSKGVAICSNKKFCNGLNGDCSNLKVYGVIKGIIVRDLCDHRLEPLVIFDSNVIENLVGQPYEDLSISDEEIQWSLDQRIASGIKFNASVKRIKKKAGSKFSPSLVLQKIVFCNTSGVQSHNPAPKPFQYVPIFNTDGDEKKDAIPFSENNEERPQSSSSASKIPILELNIEQWDPNTAVCVKRDEFTYRINSKPRGVVLLINNKNYPTEGIRIGSEKDVSNLTAFFKKINYKIFGGKAIEDIKSRKELESIISRYKDDLRNSRVDSCIIIIMGHGNTFEVSLVGQDQNTNVVNLINDIVQPISCSQFKEFKGKPKVVIVQACQNFSVSEYTRNLKLTNTEIQDVLLILPGLPGFFTYRNDFGTYFINYFLKVLMKYGRNEHLKSILNIVQSELRQDCLKMNKPHITPPYYMSVLFNNFYLFGSGDDTDRNVANDLDEEMEVD